MLQPASLDFQWFPATLGKSMRHELQHATRILTPACVLSPCAYRCGDMVMEITWDDLGRPQAPGLCFSERYAVRVDVQYKDLEQMKANPNAVFDLVRYKTYDDAETWNIGRRVR